ncbi:cupin domain-containing protein [Oscillospiraceae bacterium OttesenSCG-928-F05]|nr:cupin domain-containing protein [Oscillospiraceae bacterium OttesenSCG-928-F05]
METLIKNMAHAEVLTLAEAVTAAPGQIVSKTLAQNDHHSLTLFAFDKGEEISSHASEGDAMVLALEGEGRITIDGKDHTLRQGQSIIMPAGIPHAVFATEPFKMFLIVIFSENR